MIEARNCTDARRWRQRSWWSAVLIAGVCLAAWPSGAQAQFNPFRSYKGPALTQEDKDLGQAAAVKLLTQDQAEVGKSEAWAGLKSGNSGAVSVQKAYQRQGMECRAVRSEVRYKNAATPPRTLDLNVCRIKTGERKLM
jgi:hypothetical protein